MELRQCCGLRDQMVSTVLPIFLKLLKNMENQMKIEQEAGVMLLSKAELGRFDMMIMSEAAAKSYSAQTLYDV